MTSTESGFEGQLWALVFVLPPSSSNSIWPRRVYIPKSSLPTHVRIINATVSLTIFFVYQYANPFDFQETPHDSLSGERQACSGASSIG